MRSGGAAHKNQKRRGVLIALRAVVISSASERSFLHCGQYRIGTGRETMSCSYVFLRSHRRRLSVCKEDFSLTLEMTIRESDVSQSFTLSPGHQSLFTRPFFQAIGPALSRIVIESVAEGSFLHCGKYRIGIGRDTMSCSYIFLRSHRRRLSICKENFSLALEMTIRESDVSQSPSLLVS